MCITNLYLDLSAVEFQLVLFPDNCAFDLGYD